MVPKVFEPLKFDCINIFRNVDCTTFYFGYLFSFTLGVTIYFLKVTVTYISWSSDFALYLRQYQI